MFPAAGPDSRALYKVEDGKNGDGPAHNFRLIMKSQDAAFLVSGTQGLTRHRIGGTVVFQDQVYYDVGIRTKGSPYTRGNTMTGYNIRFYPLNLEARDMVARGDVGRIYSINGSYVQDWLLYDTDYNWRVLADQGGALRAIADIGTHWMDLVLSISGLEVESVFADLKTVHEVRNRPKGEVETFTGKTARQRETEPVPITTEDYGAVLFRFEGGARGSLHVSQVTAGRKNCLRWEIAGSQCAMAFDSQSPNELWIGRRDKPNECLLRDPALLAETPRSFANYPGGHNEGFPDAFKQCFRAFYRAIAGDDGSTAVYPTFEEGHREVVLCEAILESHRSQQWITL